MPDGLYPEMKCGPHFCEQPPGFTLTGCSLPASSIDREGIERWVGEEGGAREEQAPWEGEMELGREGGKESLALHITACLSLSPIWLSL